MVAAVGLAALAVLVATGHAATFDQWSARTLMPYQDRPLTEPSLWDQLMSPLAAVTRTGNDLPSRLLFASTLPAAPLATGVAAAIGIFALVTRGQPRRALIWTLALVSCAVAEAGIKALVERPLIHKYDAVRQASVTKDSFNHSFPSGHTVRGLLLAFLFAELVPALRPFLAAWLVVMSASLVLTSMHTPTDVAGGVLLALVALVMLNRERVRCRLAPVSNSCDPNTGSVEEPLTPGSVS
jgi:membrane-associated phospholipid phosphatase